MSLFGRKTTAIGLEERLATVENLCADLQRAKRNLELEFTELYDKVRHQMSRMAKRDAAALKADGEQLPDAPPDSPLDSVDPISRSILRRRGMPRIRQ